jgi:hypothetical protein
MPTDEVVRIRLSGNAAAVRQWLSEHPTDLGRATRDGDRVTVSMSVTEAVANELRTRGFGVEELYDVSDHARARINNVGPDNRFEGGRIPPGPRPPRKGGQR